MRLPHDGGGGRWQPRCMCDDDMNNRPGGHKEDCKLVQFTKVLHKNVRRYNSRQMN